jgi:hypothetical protein
MPKMQTQQLPSARNAKVSVVELLTLVTTEETRLHRLTEIIQNAHQKTT